MPYRAELKRPDLKGTFPCSVCGKIFCHSSSLSRHRMQAHFKSYTCTMCNQEISSNETLRSHMFRAHQISRMFMCRCCNWAFPDKTSLHIHMQSMMRNGQPGDVHILAKSSTEGGPMKSPDGSNSPTPIVNMGLSPNGLNGSLNLMSPTNHSTPLGASLGATGIFPAMPSREELINRLRARAALQGNTDVIPELNGAGNNQQSGFLASWLANNFPQMVNGGASNGNNGMVNGYRSTKLKDDDDKEMIDDENPDVSSAYSEGIEIRMDETSDDDEMSLRTPTTPNTNAGNGAMKNGNGNAPEKNENDGMAQIEPTNSEENDDEALPILRSAITANPLNSLMYKKKLNNALRNKMPSTENGNGIYGNFFSFSGGNSGRSSKSIDDIASSLRLPQSTMTNLGEGEPQASPAASDSHTSGSGPPLSAGSDGSSPQKCFDCQVMKGKIGLADNRNKFLESKVSSLDNKVHRLEAQINSLDANVHRYEGENKVMRDQCEVLERKLLACQEKAIRYLQKGHDNTCMKELLEDLLETTYFQYQGVNKESVAKFGF